MPGEFELIDRWFRALGARRGDVVLGVGDDAAVVDLPAGQQLVAAVDTLVEGRHFPLASAPRSIGHRALAVNLSDLASMGAEPRFALLALTLPASDERWLEQFAAGFDALAQQHGVALIGGDTTAGPLTISVTVLGIVERGRALTRSGARPGDVVFVSGTPGDAAAGLALTDSNRPPPIRTSLDRTVPDRTAAAATLRERFEYPTPRVALGRALSGIASSCIDVSDGLGGDLGKLAASSACGIEIDLAALPMSEALRAHLPQQQALHAMLTGGDDYELAFTLPEALAASLPAQLAAETASVGVRVTRIGRVLAGSGVWLRDGTNVTQFAHRGYDHFAAPAAD